MKLSQLLDGVQVIKLFQTTFGRMVVTHDVEVSKIQYDSRKIEKNDCFVAIRGGEADGHKFVSQAISAGAKVVVMEDDAALADSYFMHAGVIKVIVANSRKALARMAANYYGHPAEKMRMIGVTGTNGKTTTTHLVKSILEASGEKVGLMGTIEYRMGDEVVSATHTTPESLELNEYLARMVGAGCTSVSMEVSSHALHQSRVSGYRYAVAAFTNLTQDHLDYHGSMEEYFRAKKILFEGLSDSSWAVTNADDAWGMKIIQNSAASPIRYSVASNSDAQAKEISLSVDATRFRIEHGGEKTEIRSSLLGHFNVYNILAAFSVGVALGIPKSTVREGIEKLQAVNGRFERVSSPKGWTAIIDYSHTPDALEKCLTAIHDLLPKAKRGKIITVFGAGGDRDRTKRPFMAQVVGRLSDIALVTSDNPRTEDPQRIVDEIVLGFPEKTVFSTDVDRQKAIEKALAMAQPGDVVLIAGKGHEDYQVVGTKKIHFSDREVVEDFIRAQK